MVGRLNPLDFAPIVCKKCGKVALAHWLSDGYCRECYIQHKIGVSVGLYELVTSKEFKLASIRDKISILSDWEEEHPEDRVMCERLKAILAKKIRKILELKRKIVDIENEANMCLREL